MKKILITKSILTAFLLINFLVPNFGQKSNLEVQQLKCDVSTSPYYSMKQSFYVYPNSDNVEKIIFWACENIDKKNCKMVREGYMKDGNFDVPNGEIFKIENSFYDLDQVVPIYVMKDPIYKFIAIQLVENNMDSSRFFFCDKVTSIQSNSNENSIVKYDSASDYIKINNVNNNIKAVSIYNISGQVKRKVEVNQSEQIKIDCSDLKGGIYYCQIVINSETYFYKIFINK